MLNPKLGFRRLFLVLSVLWAAGAGLYLWRFAPQDDSKVGVYLDEDGNPINYLDLQGHPIPLPTRQQLIDAMDGLTKEQQLRVLDLFEPLARARDAQRDARASRRPRIDRSRLRSWLETGFVPPLIAFVLLEGLFWAVGGFWANSGPERRTAFERAEVDSQPPSGKDREQ